MEQCDILIVGGGPAGSSCAWRLRQAGADVLILDKKPFPRDKTCAGWVTPPVLDLLQLDTADYAGRASSLPEKEGAKERKREGETETRTATIAPVAPSLLPSFSPSSQRSERVFQPINSFRTGVIGGDEVYTRYDSTVSYGIRRFEFDHYLLQRSGARCVLGEPLKTLERRNGHWIINGEIQARLVIGAGGHFCPVARLMKDEGRRTKDEGTRIHPSSFILHPSNKANVVAAQEVEFEADPADLDRGSVAGETPELFFCDDLAGYGWCFRKGNFLNIGLGRVDSQQLSSHVEAFCKFLRDRKKVCCDIPARFHGHAYRLYERQEPCLVGDHLLLIGDAAGLAYPQSGEGIRPAIESGLIAADVILQANGNYEPSRLEPYRTRILERFGKPRTAGLSDWLPAGWLHFLAARLLATRWFSQQVVLDRWFLHRSEPPLQLAPPCNPVG